MELSDYDQKLVRVVMVDGEIFEGVAEYNTLEMNEALYGFSFSGIKIDEMLILSGQVESIELLENRDPEVKDGLLFRSKPQKNRIVPSNVFEELYGADEYTLIVPDEAQWNTLRKGDMIRFENSGDASDVWHHIVRSVKPAEGPESQKGMLAVELTHVE